MKKLFLLIFILVLGWGAYEMYHSHKATTTSTPPVKIQPVVTHPDPSNATFGFEDGPITLDKGSYSKDLTPTGITQETDLTDSVAYGDINNDGKNDTATILVQTSGGSGTFFYVAAYVSGLVQYKGSNAIFLGDRISPKSISINSTGTIVVTYLDRKEGEPFTSDPTVSMTKQYVFTNGELREK